MPLLLADWWAECGGPIFTRRQDNESPASSYSSTLGLTYHTKGPEKASVWTIAILKPQSTLVKSHPAASTGIGQASRRPSFLAIHIFKVLQPGCPCLTGQSPYCLNKLSYGFTWPTLFRPLLHLVYPFGHQVSTESSSLPSSLDFIIKKLTFLVNFN